MTKEQKRELLYEFINFYSQDDLNRLDMRFVADKFLEEADND